MPSKTKFVLRRNSRDDRKGKTLAGRRDLKLVFAAGLAHQPAVVGRSYQGGRLSWHDPKSPRLVPTSLYTEIP